MARQSLSQEMNSAIQSHNNFGPMRIEVRTVWDWKDRALRMEKEIERLRRELKDARAPAAL